MTELTRGSVLIAWRILCDTLPMDTEAMLIFTAVALDRVVWGLFGAWVVCGCGCWFSTLGDDYCGRLVTLGDGNTVERASLSGGG